MKRRDVLKGLGLSMGYVVATPTVISILQSCKNEPTTVEWMPAFFSPDEGKVLKNIVDLIIPTTDDSPGAVDVNVHKFIDAYLNQVSDKGEQEAYKKGMEALIATLGKPIKNCMLEDYDAVLAKYFSTDSNIADLDESAMKTLKGIRSRTIWGFKTSEEIGEKVLAYDPVPGVYSGCISLQETTEGKVWSL